MTMPRAQARRGSALVRRAATCVDPRNVGVAPTALTANRLRRPLRRAAEPESAATRGAGSERWAPAGHPGVDHAPRSGKGNGRPGDGARMCSSPGPESVPTNQHCGRGRPNERHEAQVLTHLSLILMTPQSRGNRRPWMLPGASHAQQGECHGWLGHRRQERHPSA